MGKWAAKCDNHNMRAKLDLRRYFLTKYHQDAGNQPRVLDCCQGSGLLWARLREEYPVASYWGLDVKLKKGRLTLASERLLAQSGWTQNVIDVDTYGSPWKHWEAILENLKHSATVFLTWGQGGGARVRLDAPVLRAMGMGDMEQLFRMSGAITHNLEPIAVDYMLARSAEHGITITEAVEAENPGGNARYIGCRLFVPQG